MTTPPTTVLLLSQQPSSRLVLVILIILVGTATILHCEGVRTISSVSAGVTTCYYYEQCETNTGSSGMDMDTRTMYSNANNPFNPNAIKAAYFYSEGLNLRGSVRVLLPSLTTDVVLFTAIFINSYSTASIGHAFFTMYGVMSYGSNLTISGGTLYSSRSDGLGYLFSTITFNFMLNDGATFIVENVNVKDVVGLFACGVGKTLSILKGSRMQFTNNTLDVSRNHGTTTTIANRAIIAVPRLSMSDHSTTLLLSSNMLIVQRTMQDLRFAILAIEDFGTVANNCTILLSSNTVQVGGFAHSAALTVATVYALLLTVSSSALVAVRSNNISTTQLTVNADLCVTLGRLGTLNIQGQSSAMMLEGNMLASMIVAASMNLQTILHITTTLSIESNGTLSVYSNTLSSLTASSPSQLSFHGLNLMSVGIATGGSLLCVDNNVTATDVIFVSGILEIIFFTVGNTLSISANGSALHVINNDVFVTSPSAITSSVKSMFMLIGPTLVGETSMFIARRNNFTVPQYLPTDMGKISVLDEDGGLAAFCVNTVNNRLCRGQDCLTVSGGNATVMGCTSTQTLPAEFVPTPTIHHNSTTRSPHQTPSPTKRPTPSSATLTSSLLRVPTTTATPSRVHTRTPDIPTTTPNTTTTTTPNTTATTTATTTPAPTNITTTPASSNTSTSTTAPPPTTPPPLPRTRTRTLLCSGMSDVSRGCELFRGASVVGTTPTPYPTSGNMCGSERVTVPYSVWSKGGGSARIVMPFVGAASPHVIARQSNASLVVASSVERGVVGSSRNTTDGTAWVELSVRYVGSTTLSGTTILVPIMVDNTMMVCGVSSGGAAVDVAVWLEPAPPVPPDVETTVDVGVFTGAVGGAVLGVPSGIVRAGIANSMADMLACAEFDPTGDVDLISNPLSWAVGREELQYQRGSLLLTIILVGCAGVVCVVTLMGFYLTNRGGGVMGAVRRARLPSLPLSAILLSCEVAVSPGVNVLLYKGSRSEDYVLSLCVLIPLALFLGLYAHRASVGMRVMIEKVPEADGVVAGGKGAALLRFALEPSHRPIALEEETKKANEAADDNDEDGVQVGDGERWLRGNFYFVAEKRWAAYGAIEAIVGPLVAVLEGIPMTTRSKALCIGRPAAMSVLLILLLALLLWRHPFAVRLQQWTSVIVTGGLLIASSLVVANGIAPSEELQNGAGRVIGVVSIIIMLFGAIDVVTVLLSLVPSLRVKLGIKARSLQESLDHLARSRMLTSELLLIAAQRPTDAPPTIDDQERCSTIDVDDDGVTTKSHSRSHSLLLPSKTKRQSISSSTKMKANDLVSNKSSISDFGDLEVEDDEAAALAADNSFAGVALRRRATTVSAASAPTLRNRAASTNKPNPSKEVTPQRPRRSLSMVRRPAPRPATPNQEEDDNEELSTMQVCLKMEEEDDDFAQLMEDPSFALDDSYNDVDDDDIEL